MRDKVKLHSVECFLHGMLVERIGHLGAVFCHLDPFISTQVLKWSLTAPYMRDKVKLHSVECFLHGMLVEPIGHLGAVFSHLDPFISTQVLKRSLTAPYMRDKYDEKGWSIVLSLF